MAVEMSTSLKVVVPRDALAARLQVVSRAVSSRTSVQILGGVLLRAEDGRLELAATDMEMSLRAGLDVGVSGEGSSVVPGRLFTDIVRLLPQGDVTIEHRPDEGLVAVACGPASYRLHTYDPTDFPRLPTVDPAESFAVERDAFLQTLGRVSRAASRDESRPVLTGILMKIEGATLVMAATDSYRLSVKETALSAPPAREIEAIVPARALAELARIAGAAADEQLTVTVQENQVAFAADGVLMTARRIDGQFPNYKQLRPEAFEAEVAIARDELAETVKRVSVMAQRNSALRLRFADGELTIRAQTQDVGEAQESLPIAFRGEAIEIGFNPQFLLEGIESVDAAEVRIKLISPLRPGLITGEGDDFWYLIMPIRLAS
ncbi:MAG: DNA polymerase III subunit beta [Thermoleophilia bacterium]